MTYRSRGLEGGMFVRRRYSRRNSRRFLSRSWWARGTAPTRCGESCSTLQQLEYGAFEVLVVDNAPSSDATRECVEEFAETDPRIRYLVEARGGPLASAQRRPRSCPVRLGCFHRRRCACRSVVVTRGGARNKAECRRRLRDRVRAACVARRCRHNDTLMNASRGRVRLLPRVYDLDKCQG